MSTPAGLPNGGRTVEQTAWDNWHGRKLREAQQDELRVRYGDGSEESGTPPTGDDIAVFMVARELSGEAVGCGALRQLDEKTAEIKRMYVVPAHRGRGIAREILAALEDYARVEGWTRLLLETGDLQHESLGLYESSGYQRIQKFGSYANVEISICLGKDL